jgi:hypothetical protein
MIAARMVMAFLKEAATGALPKLPPNVKHLSVNELSVLVLADAKQSDAENVETRIWRPSLPVIHIAAATAVALDSVERGRKPAIDNYSLLMDRSIVEWIISASQEIEQLVEKSTHLKPHSGQLIRLRQV